MNAKYRKLATKTWHDCIVLKQYGPHYFCLVWDWWIEDFVEVLVPAQRVRITRSDE